ncbi:manganese-superoxide dismutase, partial [Sodiomyces alkalinus F11]
MELHHSKHHQTYVNNLNKATEAYNSNPLQNRIAVLAAINFNGGGHINHSLFWENLTPAASPAAKPESAPKLVAEITKIWGGLDKFKAAFNASLLGITGSGWGWLVKDETTGLSIVTTKDQDPITKGVPVFGVDMWEHAYYLQVSADSCCTPSLSSLRVADL